MGFQKKASVSTELVLGSAVVEMKKMLTANETATAALKGLVDQSEGIQLRIAAEEDRLTALKTEWEEKARAAAVDFQVKFRADQQKTVDTVLGEAGKVAVIKEVWEATQQNLEEYKAAFVAKVKEEVGAATGAIAKQYEYKEKQMEAEFRAREAENLAKINALNGQVTFLSGQVDHWKKELSDERAASVERSKHGAPNVNVGTGFSGK